MNQKQKRSLENRRYYTENREQILERRKMLRLLENNNLSTKKEVNEDIFTLKLTIILIIAVTILDILIWRFYL